MANLPNGAALSDPAALKARSLELHETFRGKIQSFPKCPIHGLDDFAYWYTPGVAEPCREIERNPEDVYRYTNKGNTVAIATDGSRVLGLGNIGPLAGLPVMEGKALLFKYLGGVDAIPICLATKGTEDFIRTVKALEPSFGAINLEDIAQPRCFTILDRLRDELSIPVWHDDQQGTATVVLAALINALKIVEKELSAVKIALIGVGAANVAVYRILASQGINKEALIACDSVGILHRQRSDIERRQSEYSDKWKICLESNSDNVTGGIGAAMQGADVCIAFAGPELIQPEWIESMAPNAIVFACANPVPEILPDLAKAAGARIIGTGRSDFPNQVNNSLTFPGLFRGVIDVGATTITERMALGAANALADQAARSGLRADAILPPINDREVPVAIAIATARAAIAEGVARWPLAPDVIESKARRAIGDAAEEMRLMLESDAFRKHEV